MREGELEKNERGQERCEVFNLVHPRSQFILAVSLLCHKTKGEEMKRNEREAREGRREGERGRWERMGK